MFGPAWIMAAVRGAHLAAMLSLLGTAGCLVWMLPRPVPDSLGRRLRRWLWASGLVALVAGGAWLVLQSAAIAGAGTLADLLVALPVVVLHTRFGHVMAARLGLLAAAALLAGLPNRGAVWGTLVLGAAAVCLQGLIGHAGATGGAIGDGLVLSESLHLLAAGLWLGALPALWFGLCLLPDRQAAILCEGFSPIGLGCVVVLAGSGLAQAIELIGGLPALFGTTYGHFALLKIGLFLVALVLAAVNRIWLTDRLGDGVALARRHLLVSVLIETLVGLAIVTAAAFMASSPPAAHTIPVWPFPWQLSLVTVTEDADFRREVIVSAVLIAAAAVLLIGALVWGRYRLVALGLLAVVIAWRGPSFDLLVVEAYPTSFQVSPTDFSAASIVRGQALYGPYCANCHGAEGAGDGPGAAGLRIRPADLTMPHLWEHSDGTLFWWLSHGIDDAEGGLAMPGFAGSLTDDDRWALIDFIRARNAGMALKQGPFPVRAPSFPIRCAGLAASATTDLVGRAVQVVFDAPAEGQTLVPVVILLLRPGAAPPLGGCSAATQAAPEAYAILADEAVARLAGTAFLIDPNGWLRAVNWPDDAGGWHTPDQLAAAIRAIIATPVQSLNGGDNGHHH